MGLEHSHCIWKLVGLCSIFLFVFWFPWFSFATLFAEHFVMKNMFLGLAVRYFCSHRDPLFVTCLDLCLYLHHFHILQTKIQ